MVGVDPLSMYVLAKSNSLETLSVYDKNTLLSLLKDHSAYPSLEEMVGMNEMEGNHSFSGFRDMQLMYYYIHRPTHDDETKNRTEGTKKEYIRDLLQFFTFLQVTMENENDAPISSYLKEAHKRHIRSYQEWLKNLIRKDGKMGYPSSTRARKTTVVKSFLQWLYDEDIIKQPLPIAFKKSTYRKEERPDRSLSLNKVQDLLHYYKDHPVNHALLIILFTTGLRVNEVATAKWSNVYYDATVNGGSYFLRVTTKGNKRRDARIFNTTMDSIKRMRQLRGLKIDLDPTDDSPLFCTNKGNPYSYKYLSNYIIRIIGATDFDWLKRKEGNISPHWARHFFVTYSIIQKGIPIDVVQHTVGHSSRSTTEAYIDKYLDKKKDATWGWDEGVFT